MSSGPICGDGCCDNGSDPLATTCPMMGGEDYYNCPADCAPPPPGSMGPPPPGSMGSMMGPPPPYPPPGSMGSMSGMGSMGSMGGGSMGPPPPAPGGLPCDPAMCIPMFPGDAAMCHMPMCMGCADCMAPPPHPPPHHGPAPAHPPPHHGPPPCAMTCPTHMPTCAEFHQYVGPGGCASTCPDDLKMEGHIMFCKDEHGGPPPCAATCPRDYHPSCDEFRGMIAPGGCGSTCSDELKREYEAMLCPAPPPHHGPAPAPAYPPPHHGPPPCAATCPSDKLPTCTEFHQMIG